VRRMTRDQLGVTAGSRNVRKEMARARFEERTDRHRRRSRSLLTSSRVRIRETLWASLWAKPVNRARGVETKHLLPFLGGHIVRTPACGNFVANWPWVNLVTPRSIPNAMHQLWGRECEPSALLIAIVCLSEKPPRMPSLQCLKTAAAAFRSPRAGRESPVHPASTIRGPIAFTIPDGSRLARSAGTSAGAASPPLRFRCDLIQISKRIPIHRSYPMSRARAPARRLCSNPSQIPDGCPVTRHLIDRRSRCKASGRCSRGVSPS
jgi:hypothetical protein